jgi:hypothetical protein
MRATEYFVLTIDVIEWFLLENGWFMSAYEFFLLVHAGHHLVYSGQCWSQLKLEFLNVVYAGRSF